MSVKVQSRVWENSQAKGTELLVLLAIADHADNDGLAWPGIPAVAQKSRISDRQCQRIVNSLIKMGEIYTDARKGGRKQTTLYLVTAGLDPDALQVLLISRFELTPIEALAAVNEIAKHAKKGDIYVTLSGAKKGDIQGQKGDIQGQKGDIDVTRTHEPS